MLHPVFGDRCSRLPAPPPPRFDGWLVGLGSGSGTVYGAKSGNDEDLPRKMVIASSGNPNGATPRAEPELLSKDRLRMT